MSGPMRIVAPIPLVRGKKKSGGRGPKLCGLTMSGDKFKPIFIENCVIAGQYYENILQPQVSTTPGIWCFVGGPNHTFYQSWKNIFVIVIVIAGQY